MFVSLHDAFDPEQLNRVLIPVRVMESNLIGCTCHLTTYMKVITSLEHKKNVVSQ